MVQFFKVTGDSLSPDFQEGDFVLLVKIPFFLRTIKPGDVVVFRHALFGTMIKRVERIIPEGDLIEVIGTHTASADSRLFGPIHRSDLVGKVLWHLPRSA